MFGGRRKESQIRRDLKKAPATEPDTHNKVIRCGIENAPLLTVIVGPYMYVHKALYILRNFIMFKGSR